MTPYKFIIKSASLLPAVAAMMLASSCEDSTQAGGSLVQDETEIVMDSSFVITGHSVEAEPIQSRTTMQQLGQIDAGEFGRYSSDIITQFMPVATIDTAGLSAAQIDSVRLVLRMQQGAFVGDSVVPMGLKVYPLNRQITSPIYSNFEPKGYYDPTPIASTTYAGAVVAQDSTITIGSKLYKDIYVNMPVEVGREIFSHYLTSPETFRTPTAFAKWFPGLYIANSFGSGRVVNFTSNTLRVYYHLQGDTSVVNKVATYLGVTPEVISNNCIRCTPSEELKSRVAAGEPILAGPCGYNMQLRFPGRELVEAYRSQSGPLAIVNSLSLSLPAREISSIYNLMPPQYVLMVRKDKLQEFFAKNSLPDGKTAFYAAYNSDSHQYVFSDMRQYMIDLLDKKTIEDADVDFILMPVNISFYTSGGLNNYNYYNYYNSYSYYYNYYYTTPSNTSVNEVIPFIEGPVMAKFDLKKAKILFTFSKQTINF